MHELSYLIQHQINNYCMIQKFLLLHDPSFTTWRYVTYPFVCLFFPGCTTMDKLWSLGLCSGICSTHNSASNIIGANKYGMSVG